MGISNTNEIHKFVCLNQGTYPSFVLRHPRVGELDYNSHIISLDFL